MHFICFFSTCEILKPKMYMHVGIEERLAYVYREIHNLFQYVKCTARDVFTYKSILD